MFVAAWRCFLQNSMHDKGLFVRFSEKQLLTVKANMGEFIHSKYVFLSPDVCMGDKCSCIKEYTPKSTVKYKNDKTYLITYLIHTIQLLLLNIGSSSGSFTFLELSVLI